MADSLLWLQGLRDHYLALEIFYHVWVEADFGGLLGQRHGVDFVLQLEQGVEKIFGARRASGDVDIRRDDFVDALQYGVGIERAAHGRARAHRDDPLRVGHLIVDALYYRGHFQRDGAGDDHQVALARAGTEHFRTEAGDVEARGGRRDHFDGAAGQAKGHRP